MNWASLQLKNPYLKYLNDKWNQLATALENSSGHVNNVQTESGLDSIGTSWLKRGRSILIRRTSGPNTITIRTTSVRPSSNQTASNTTNPDTSPAETVNGTSKENV